MSHVGCQVSLTVQAADDSLRLLPWRRRGCRFRDEHRLAVTGHYSQHNCLENCRLRVMAEQCGCLLPHLSVRRATNLCAKRRIS